MKLETYDLYYFMSSVFILIAHWNSCIRKYSALRNSSNNSNTVNNSAIIVNSFYGLDYAQIPSPGS